MTKTKTVFQKTLPMSGITVFVDSRESVSIVNYLNGLGAKTIHKQLRVADYICSDRVGIERKSVVSNTPVAVKIDGKTRIKTIKDVFSDFNKKKKIKVMGVDINNHNIGWFDVYDMTIHKSDNVYGISFSHNKKRRKKMETPFGIQITNGHNVYVFRNKRIICIPTQELRIGDYLLLVPPKLEEKQFDIYDSFEDYLKKIQEKSTKDFKVFENKFKLNSACCGYKIPKFNKDLFFMLGLWTADGHLFPSGVKIAQKNEERNHIIEDCMREVFGGFSEVKKNYSCGGKVYYNLFSDIFEGKSGSQHKEIPPFVFSASPVMKSWFLKGYFFGDGWVNVDKNRKNPQIKALSKSKMLTVGLSYLLYSFGIENTVRKVYKTYSNRRMPYYEFSVKTKSLKRFLNKIGQIPTKEIKTEKTVSTKIPHYAQKNFYRPLLRLKKKEINDFYEIMKKLRIVHGGSFYYIEEFKKIVKNYSNKKEFSAKHGLSYSTVRNITNGYSKNPSLFLEIVNIIRREKTLPPVEIDFKLLKCFLKKLKINSYLNRRCYLDTISKKQPPGLIKNIYERVEKKAGIDSIFLLSKIYNGEMALERVRNIEKIRGEHEVYDFSVKDAENFVGGVVPVLLHNTISDFTDSIINQRIFKQMGELADSFERPLLILEGNPELLFHERNIHPNVIRGVLSSIGIGYKVPMIWTSNTEETAYMIYWIAKKEQEDDKRELQIRSKVRQDSPQKQQEFLVTGLPSVSNKLAKRMLAKFKTVRKVFNAKPERLMKVEGLGKEKAKKIWELINKEYEEE